MLLSKKKKTTIDAFQPLVCIAATTHGRLFLLRVTSMSGKVNISHHDFSLSRPQTTFSRLKFWGSAEPVYSAGNVNAVCLGAPLEDGFQVWTLVELNIVRWTVMNEGWEQVILYMLGFFTKTDIFRWILNKIYRLWFHCTWHMYSRM